MNAVLQIIIPQVFVGSLPLWYYHVRIGWLGRAFHDRISMRWFDVAVLGVLAACGYVFIRQARVSGTNLTVRLFRIAMLMSVSLAACLAFAVLLLLVLVPHVPAHFPPATPATWISLALDYAAPAVAVAIGSSFAVSLLYVRFTQNNALRRHQPAVT